MLRTRFIKTTVTEIFFIYSANNKNQDHTFFFSSATRNAKTFFIDPALLLPLFTYEVFAFSFLHNPPTPIEMAHICQPNEPPRIHTAVEPKGTPAISFNVITFGVSMPSIL